MKRALLTSMIGAIALAGSGIAFAGHHEGGEHEDKAKKHAEYKAKKEEKLKARFAAADTDENGSISREEFLAQKAAEAEKSWAKHAEYLGDDGELSMDEAKAMMKAKWAERKGKGKAKH